MIDVNIMNVITIAIIALLAVWLWHFGAAAIGSRSSAPKVG